MADDRSGGRGSRIVASGIVVAAAVLWAVGTVAGGTAHASADPGSGMAGAEWAGRGEPGSHRSAAPIDRGFGRGVGGEDRPVIRDAGARNSSLSTAVVDRTAAKEAISADAMLFLMIGVFGAVSAMAAGLGAGIAIARRMGSIASEEPRDGDPPDSRDPRTSSSDG